MTAFEDDTLRVDFAKREVTIDVMDSLFTWVQSNTSSRDAGPPSRSACNCPRTDGAFVGGRPPALPHRGESVRGRSAPQAGRSRPGGSLSDRDCPERLPVSLAEQLNETASLRSEPVCPSNWFRGC